MSQIILETERLILRTTDLEDADSIASLWSDPVVTQFSGGPREYQKVFQMVVDDSANPIEQLDMWNIIEKKSGIFIGNSGLLEKNIDNVNEVEIIYYLRPEYWGKGFAAEISFGVLEYARTKLNLKRVVALIDDENVSSKFVAEKIGLKFEKKVKRGENFKSLYTIHF